MHKYLLYLYYFLNNSVYLIFKLLTFLTQFKISHAIKRYVRLGFDLTTGEDIEKALDGLSGTSTAYLKPNRNQRSQSNVKTIPGISNWFEWTWPIELAGCVCARDLPDFGDIKIFSMSKFIKTELVQPEPMVGKHSEVTSKWTMPIYRASGKLSF